MSLIFPELIELTNDEECCVRIAGVETLTELISFLDEETLRSDVVPLVKKFCEQALMSGDNSLPVVARLLGRLCHELKGTHVRVSRCTICVCVYVCVCI